MQQPNPNLVTIEFLKLSGVIPTDWQLAKQPVNNDRVSQLLFTNGVSIIAEPNRIMFGETIGEREIASSTVAAVAQKYLEIFKLAKYLAISINIRSYSPQVNSVAATEYINHQLLAAGSWQNYGVAPVQASLNLVYTLPDRQLSLEVAAAGMQVADREMVPVVLFSGNFNYHLGTPETGADIAVASRVIDNWQTDLATYSELISDRFLSPNQSTISVPTSIDIDRLAQFEIPYAPDLDSVGSLS
ncbi:hypothetical protein [Chamaesiphon sp. VAR_69_metabat_338]|uniref:hypothetical protein n=1 Tax=Chamaesiphon sp. VAR_69_metabat_338 TaxID=2964704 RepID=UPI00286DAA5A|nr:hypothetical protein [Chamaesiphon sp. VAR_69_metabat_338]